MNSETIHKAELTIGKFYLKSAIFKSADTPHVFDYQWRPNFKVSFQIKDKLLQDSNFEVNLKVTVDCTNKGEDAYQADVEQVGVFDIKGLPDKQVKFVIATFCANALFPYAREAIDSLVVKGGFNAVQLAPINFEAMFQKKQEDDENGEQAFKSKERLTH